FDPNGEYANENVQDNNSALKNIWKFNIGATKDTEVATYGLTGHPHDPDRNLMLINFFEDKNLTIGKSVIDSILSGDTTAYIKNFAQVSLEKPDPNDGSAMTRFNRQVLAYKAVLARAGFDIPSNIKPSLKGLFNPD